uniref:Bm9723, isoform a n=1 Tax=Brugia malayi TaxID=6279 RepID=A0A1I9G1X0_BRUMA|nr:Bm9723, isoform a [Brugia malayi]
MNLFYYSVLLTLILKLCTSFLNFPSDNIRRLRILDVIGGYPSFFGAIYVHNDPSYDVLSRTEIKSSRFMPLSTVLHFTIKPTYTTVYCMINCIEMDSYHEYNKFQERSKLYDRANSFEKETIGSYVFGDEVRISGQLSLLRPDTNGLCTHIYEQPMKYKVNYTASCRWHFHTEKGCDVNNLVEFLSNQMNGTEVCDQTGDQDMVTASSDQKCDNYSLMSVRLATQKGSILGALVEFLPSSNKCRENYCILTTKISFEEVTQRFLDKMKMSRYENSEGRFRCPSEITCPAELFYFLNTFDVGEFSTQFFVLIPLFMLLLFHMS